ncbi:hypothetical protein DUI87_19002 [Hirundo rustica rustica]|uniref:RNase H type-1 domain-containing protein n=1 Tax=Hirundo rustica rustica TaxID=333673 RepID=A0A3M0JT17_HIRRU|nr:hypothetical protein DUI87_19002 [Hirundo rustica rustica]
MTGWCQLWIYNYGVIVKPLHELVKVSKNAKVWTPEADKAFKELKCKFMRAPALRLPDMSKPFWLFSHERQRIALGVLAQRLGLYKRAVAYFSKATGHCEQATFLEVTAVTVNIDEARKFTLRQKMTFLVSHTVMAVLEQNGNHWLSSSRFLKYQAVLAQSDDIDIQVTNIVNPASFLQGKSKAEPVVHSFLKTIETMYSSHPDLKEEPLQDANNWFTDSSSFIKQEMRMARYAVTTVSKVIESNSLPARTLAQKAKLAALTQTLELAKGKIISIWTDFKYAYEIVHAHGAISKERRLLTAQKKVVKYATDILRLLVAVELPSQVVLCIARDTLEVAHWQIMKLSWPLKKRNQ